jgi:hypothetical protein
VSVLSDAERDALRREASALLPETAEILAPSGALDSRGNRQAGEQVIGTTAAWLRGAGLSPQEREAASRLGWAVAYAVDLPFEAAVHPSHRLRIGQRTFEVGAVVREGDWGLLATAICAERGG